METWARRIPLSLPPPACLTRQILLVFKLILISNVLKKSLAGPSLSSDNVFSLVDVSGDWDALVDAKTDSARDIGHCLPSRPPVLSSTSLYVPPSLLHPLILVSSSSSFRFSSFPHHCPSASSSFSGAVEVGLAPCPEVVSH